MLSKQRLENPGIPGGRILSPTTLREGLRSYALASVPESHSNSYRG
jgi:hypothetical protein